jgi:hypothetical protein
MTVWAAAHPAEDRAGTVDVLAEAAAFEPSGTNETTAANAASAASVSGPRARTHQILPATVPSRRPGHTVRQPGRLDQSRPPGDLGGADDIDAKFHADMVNGGQS